MKIAITADIHLKSQADTPNRFNAFRYILDQMLKNNITDLIIAGDLFDKDATNYSEFDNLLSEDKYNDLSVRVIRGNHDINLRDKAFTSDNLEVIDESGIVSLGNSKVPFLFLPYKEETSMGEEIAEFANDLPKENWILIGHGDYLESVREPNPYEMGIYMPLSRKDMSQFKPLYAFLGHIHKPCEIGKVIYAGSPSPIQINETGPRRFIIFDTQELTFSSKKISYGKINFVENLMILPVENENRLVKEQLDRMVAKWKEEDVEPEEVVLRSNVNGYTKSKKDLNKFIVESLMELNISQIEEYNIDNLHSIEAEPEKVKLANDVREHMQTQSLAVDDDTMPSEHEILLQIQKTIFEV